MKRAAQHIITVLLIILLLPIAIATIDAPQEVHQGEQASIEFPQGQTLHKQGNPITNNSPYYWQTNHTHLGSYDFSTDDDTHTITVLNQSLDVTIKKPLTNDHSTTSIPVELRTNMPAEFCYTKINTNTNTLTQQNATTHTGTITLPQDGVYTVEFKCKAGNEIVTKERTLLADTTPPNITSLTPTKGLSLQGEEVELRAVTNEAATCNYWRLDEEETNAQALPTTDWLEHKKTITPGEGHHNYSVRCTDVHGNEMSDKKTTHFTLTPIPSAKILVDSTKEVLKQGTYDVRITTNNPIQEINLRYDYQQNTGSTITLEETRSNKKEWEGVLVVDDIGVDVGTFTIRLKDEQGIESKKIREGKTFRVKTTTPPKITGLQVEQINASTGSRNELRWDAQDDILQYHIYRSEKNTVTKDDFLATVTNNHYQDTAIEPNTQYNYAILAEDRAGNKGELSTQQGIHTQARNDSSKEEQELYEQEQLQEKIAKALLDTQMIIETLDEEQDEQKITIIRETKILETLQEHQQKLSAAQEELEEAALSTSRKSSIRSLVEQTDSLLVQKITITGSTRYEEGSNELVRARIFDEITSTQDTQTNTQHRSLTDTINNQRTTRGQIILAEILYSNRTTKNFVYVEQQITLPRQETSTQLYVTIPQQFTQDLSLISTNQDHEIDHSLNALVFTIPEQQSRFEYTLLTPTKQTLSTTRELRNTILPPSPEQQTTQDLITGRTVFSEMVDWETLNPWYLLGGLIILILLAYYVFMDAPITNQPTTHSVPQPMQEFFTTLTKRLEQQPFFERRQPINNPFFTKKTFPKNHHTIIPPTPSTESLLPQSRHIQEQMAKPEVQSAILDAVPAQKLLSQAHKAIDNKQYLDARKDYELLTEKIKKQPLTLQERASVNELYNKLLLYREVQQAINAAQDKNVHKLRTKMKVIRAAAKRLPEEDTLLVKQAKERYEKLLSIENKLLIEQEDY